MISSPTPCSLCSKTAEKQQNNLVVMGGNLISALLLIIHNLSNTIIFVNLTLFDCKMVMLMSAFTTALCRGISCAEALNKRNILYVT